MFLFRSSSASHEVPDRTGSDGRMEWTGLILQGHLFTDAFNGVPMKWGSRACVCWFSSFVSCPVALCVPKWAVGKYCAVESSYCLGCRNSFWTSADHTEMMMRSYLTRSLFYAVLQSFTGSIGVIFSLPSLPKYGPFSWKNLRMNLPLMNVHTFWALITCLTFILNSWHTFSFLNIATTIPYGG